MKAIVLVGHGSTARDMPRELVREMKALERSGADPARVEVLDEQIRNWPRTPENDPYKHGMEQVAAHLTPKVSPARVYVAFNELCAPSVPQAIDTAIAAGAERVTLVTVMVTPGGHHSEEDIPALVVAARARHPGVTVHYAWPYDLDRVADLFAHAARAGE